ncbi:hypothetical protein GIB67_031234 [Kingdonia uniflora]|uniref:Uncharacterized protein n=1 Tax=Kingdonia uniflora TaxID=39325 RepID=A0A7J7NK76_9MAGN|nr:hypothetical protein GIB67_031234 [Kingdonia uniflora]
MSGEQLQLQRCGNIVGREGDRLAVDKSCWAVKMSTVVEEIPSHFLFTFSRVDPQGKLVIGGRKASSDVQPSNRENKTPQTWSPFSTNAGIDNRKVTVSEDVSTPLRPLQESGESTSYSSMNHINLTDPASSWAKAVKPGGKNEYGDKFARKRKISTLGSKSKSLQTDIEDIIEIKITWEEAQGLLRPPPEYAPNIMFFDGHEFEESEEAPIVGKPAIFATNELR